MYGFSLGSFLRWREREIRFAIIQPTLGSATLRPRRQVPKSKLARIARRNRSVCFSRGIVKSALILHPKFEMRQIATSFASSKPSHLRIYLEPRCFAHSMRNIAISPT
jgi:hypothetical protein